MPKIVVRVVSPPLAELIERGDSAAARGAAAVEELRKILKSSRETREWAGWVYREHKH